MKGDPESLVKGFLKPEIQLEYDPFLQQILVEHRDDFNHKLITKETLDLPLTFIGKNFAHKRFLYS